MAKTTTPVKTAPVWVDMSVADAGAAITFYWKLFGWKGEPSSDPAYGGYAVMKLGEKDVAGIGPAQQPGQPAAWSVYIGTDDADAIATKVEAAGGKVVAPPFEVGDLGRMAVFQDPGGAFISVWQPAKMAGTQVSGKPNSPGWWELNARGVDEVKPFYTKVFGWTEKTSKGEQGRPPYTEFQLGGHSIAGAMEMAEMVPAEVPNHWLVYFAVADVDAATKTASELGARVAMQPMDYPGGRFSVVIDPQGAAFGLMSS